MVRFSREMTIFALSSKLLRPPLQLFAVFCLIFLAACSWNKPRELVLLDFESDAVLDRVHWDCHTLMSLSDRHVTHGKSSLRLELYPSPYPGLAPKLTDRDWRGYEELILDVFSVGEEEVHLTVRIDDRDRTPEYKDRYNKRFVLKTGMNQIKIPLTTLVTSGTHRKLELDGIRKLLLFTVNPKQKTVLYVDYVRLSI